MKRILPFLMVAALVPAAYGQSRHQTPANLGLGGGGTAYMDSYDANFLNPANLMLRNDRKTRLSIGLSGFSVGGGGSLADITTYNEYLTKDLTLTSQLSTTMLNDWFGTDPDASAKLGYEIAITPLGASYHRESWSASLAVRNRVIGDLGANRGLAEAFFHGLDPAIFGTGRPVNFSTNVMAFTEISLGYAMRVMDLRGMKLYAGIAPKLLMGHTVQQVDFKSTLTANNGALTHVFDYSIRTYGQMADDLHRFSVDYAAAPNDDKPVIGDYVEPGAGDFAGVQSNGLGLDLGATLVMSADFIPIPDWGFFAGPRQLAVGLSITDIGKIGIAEGSLFRSAGTVTFDGFTYDAVQIDEQFDGDFGKYTESVFRDSIGTDQYLGFSRDGTTEVSRGLPTTINLGTHLKIGRLGLMLDLGAGMNDHGINSTRMYTALGAEYRFFGFLPLRMGLRAGGNSNTTYHVGTGLEFRNFEFSFGAASSSGSKENGAGIHAAFSGLVFHF